MTALALAPVGATHYLILSALLFAVGTAGLLSRRNVFAVLMSTELMLNAANLAFVAFARMHQDPSGHVAAFLVIAVAAAEVCVGLAIVLALYRLRESVDLDLFTSLRG